MKLMTRKLGIFSITLSAFIVGLTTSMFAQSVAVTPKKVVYRRPEPKIPYKKTFSITYPKISGVSSVIKRKLESELDYEKVFEFTVKEETTEVQWLTEAFYKINVNRAGVLSVSLTISGVGSYPSESTRNLSFDTKTGERIRISEQTKEAHARLISKLNELLKKEVAEFKKLLRDPKYDLAAPEMLFGEIGETEGFDTENIENFAVGAKGLTFHYDYGFPHVAKALEPPGRFFLPWSALRPYISGLGVFRKLSQ